MATRVGDEESSHSENVVKAAKGTRPPGTLGADDYVASAATIIVKI